MLSGYFLPNNQVVISLRAQGISAFKAISEPRRLVYFWATSSSA